MDRRTEERSLEVDIHAQPDDTTCGPTCLEAIYRFYGDSLPLSQVIAEVPTLKDGGTLGVLLGNHALSRGYRATIFTYNLTQFDPTWLAAGVDDLAERLRQQRDYKADPRLKQATGAYLDFLSAGGKLQLEDLTTGLIRRYLKRSVPILTGLSATYLYRERREISATNVSDDVRGEPSGHFVILCGYDPDRREVLVADPLRSNPLGDQQKHRYWVGIDRLLCAVLLGIVTYDANLLIIEPRRRRKSGAHAHSGGRQ